MGQQHDYICTQRAYFRNVSFTGFRTGTCLIRSKSSGRDHIGCVLRSYAHHADLYTVSLQQHIGLYAGKQAGVQLTRMVSIPRVFGGEDIRAEQFAELEDGHIYRIDQAQRGYDADGLPITTLSLAEPEGKYEILQDSDGA